MDTSETYIKMCEGAGEIQGLRSRQTDFGVGDYYWWSVDKDIHIAHTSHHLDYNVFHPEVWDFLVDRKIIWLPRQDQLQEMIGGGVPLYNLARFMAMLGYKTSSFGGVGVYEHPSPPRWWLEASMEQLWLAFVMKEKYNKVWMGRSG